MKIFIDSGNLKDIEALVPLGIIDGITTNPTLLAKEKGAARDILKKICDVVRACKTLSAEGVRVNVTLVFSPSQALLAAKVGATYVSPFVGRLDDIATSGMNLIHEIVDIFEHYDFPTEILVASTRHPMHIVEAARMGADICTCPPAVIDALFKHPLTDVGLKKFIADWEKAQAQLAGKA